MDLHCILTDNDEVVFLAYDDSVTTQHNINTKQQHINQTIFLNKIKISNKTSYSYSMPSPENLVVT